ncbi:MAG: cell division ATP-binding protein FtsE [Thermacetogeniaceae bacterium]|nr:cell division ATP-binding protein FtsE [Thermoanaerobacterales bacterium]NLN20851.1 cell division ATP-binding protein FtsE [Syntrophomonadaceae bacterium]HAF17488.1 cell division ATP-binding protein FtsE [Peptococcaceae bacterium]
MISFFNVSKVYPNGVKALQGVSLQIEKGEFVFIVGPSGAGKSTLIKLIFREELPTKGQIYISGRSILRMKRRDVPHLRRQIGMVFQDFRLLPDRTIYENVAFAMQVVGARRSEIKKRVPEVLKMVGLGKRMDNYPPQLSGGEQQRTAIARALVNKPSTIIADEPTGNLDIDTSWEIMECFQEINDQGTTIIIATHAKEIVDSMRQRVIALESGKIVRDEHRGVYANAIT